MRTAKNLLISNNTLHVKAHETSIRKKVAGSSIGRLHVRGTGRGRGGAERHVHTILSHFFSPRDLLIILNVL